MGGPAYGRMGVWPCGRIGRAGVMGGPACKPYGRGGLCGRMDVWAHGRMGGPAWERNGRVGVIGGPARRPYGRVDRRGAYGPYGRTP
jgi:hypothetical protein